MLTLEIAQVLKRKRVKQPASVRGLLIRSKKTALSISEYDLKRDGYYVSVLRGAFIKAFEYAWYCNKFKVTSADEGSYFLAAGLRGICEDIIVLKYIKNLPEDLRSEFIYIHVMKDLERSVQEQNKFFADVRPFQPVIRFKEDNTFDVNARTRLIEIGNAAPGLLSSAGRLLPIEQMANRVGLRSIYDYFYRMSSSMVHFNPRLILRNGWGSEDGGKGKLSTRNFCRYYLEFSQTYSVFLLSIFCETFQSDVGLSEKFLREIQRIQGLCDDDLRWPEAVTFEEMNRKGPGTIMRVLMKVAHEQEEK